MPAERLPDQVERLLGGIEGVRGVRELAAGGSAATVLRIDRPEAGDLVLKLQVARPDLVDGHDLATFRRKQRQLAHLRPRAPAVWRRYPRVLHELNGDGWSAVLMPHVDGGALGERLRHPAPDAGRFARALAGVLDRLAGEGYRVRSFPAGPRHGERVHLDRIARRHHLLTQLLPGPALRDGLVVNGVRCQPPLAVLARLRASDRWPLLCPRRACLPVHGDLNTRNVLLPSPAGRSAGAAFRLIDPRGTTRPTDLVYDLAKLLLSASLWDAGLLGGFAVTRSRDGGLAAYEVRMGPEHGVAHRQATLAFADVVAGVGEVTRLLDPSWPAQLLFAHAVHAIAEAACRVSDRRPRAGGRGDLALAFALLGTLLLNDLAARLARSSDVCPAEHLALLPDRARP